MRLFLIVMFIFFLLINYGCAAEPPSSALASALGECLDMEADFCSTFKDKRSCFRDGADRCLKEFKHERL